MDLSRVINAIPILPTLSYGVYFLHFVTLYYLFVWKVSSEWQIIKHKMSCQEICQRVPCIAILGGILNILLLGY